MDREKIMKNFQQFGKSLLLPITLLAAVGIIVGLTASLNREAVANLLPFMANEHVSYVLLSIRTLSLWIFDLIPVLFAISIAFGMAKKEPGVAALSGFITYYTMLASAKVMVSSGYIDYPLDALANVLGITDTINLGAFGGIIAGLLAMKLHNKYVELKLPTAIAFFGGKRSVAIMCILYSVLLGQVLPFIWYPVSQGINAIGLGIAGMGYIGSFLYGFIENLLVPTGLHHILISIFRTTEVGGVLTIDGVQYVGAWNAFFAGFGEIPMSELGEFTRYLAQGRIPVFMFGFPAAALAMYTTATAKKKEALKPLLSAGFLAIFITGIQEPLLFLFLFCAPALYVFNAFMCGVSLLLMDMLGVVIGNTQGGFIDLIVYGVMAPGSNWIYAVIVGIGFFVIYYFVFRWYILKFKVVIAPGVGDEVEGEEEQGEKVVMTADEQVTNIIKGLGGPDNIDDAYNCFTRLRVDIKSINDIDEKLLIATGAVSINKVSDTHIQVIYGPKVDTICTAVNDALSTMR
ncbi:MAG: PTS trehalose transporter subunit IIBC [Epulopiscium sp. Nele67-Bin002]|nr:MAG: PTS trehalose transporter subunit IIBC [Epulopiscium sp. Nele67-Bin002]